MVGWRSVFLFRTLIQRYVGCFGGDGLVRRADDLVGIDQFLKAMCRPASDTGDGEDRGEQFRRKTERSVYKAAVEVHIGTDTFINTAFLTDDFCCQTLHTVVEGKFGFPALFNGKFLDKALEDSGSGVGDQTVRLDQMPHRQSPE